VPAGTTRSPALSSSWYPVIPASPHSAISGRSLALGLRTPISGAASASASAATASRATASPAGPRRGTATAMAGKALAQSSTVPAAASEAVTDCGWRMNLGWQSVMLPVCCDHHLRSSYKFIHEC
jgi:hypothetical protein